MDPKDEEKTAFYTDEGTFCYTKMSFGLKNAGVTYQCFMNQLFEEQRDRNVEIYVDDLVIKSKHEEGMLRDIRETFQTLRRANMKLNPGKCSSRVEEGKFLGVLVTKGGIRANPEKVEALIQMKSPKSLKELQWLNGRLVALNRFLSKIATRTLSFMAVLRRSTRKSKFCWDCEAEEAFQDLKKHLGILPTIATPQPGETLILGSNKKADALSKLAAIAFDHLAKEVKVETLQQPSVTKATVTYVGTQGDSWMTPLLEYLQEGKVSKDKEEERKLRVKALQYEVIEGGLYRKSYLGPSVECIGSEEAEYVIREIREGICGMHMGAKMLVARAIRAGYYWPAMFFSVVTEIQKCDHCLIHAPMGRKPKFGLSYAIICDNGKQFANNPLREWCLQLNIKQKFTSVAHPQASGQVEQANRSMVEGIKARLGREKGSWVEELPHVLWAHRTMPKTSNGETPFRLTYGTEAMIPAEIGAPNR
ncbi:uncharacterized protein LOC143542952 [Bidens hawaiensis]|uniref:uncharacterized protein LOC143542952 n=1 Tax=Bidens hawaiensis TaxID=980011 RepID=UPI00404A23D1